MTHSPHEPLEGPPAVRARVPEHVGRGVFSTGVIVMTGNTEFVLDFVQNLGRPHQITARIVMPHAVLPQFADALATNIGLYQQRYGALPASAPVSVMVSNSPTAQPITPAHPPEEISGSALVGAGIPTPPPRRPTAQEVYDDLKLRDELLSGVYANAVMIGHGQHEFSFDFITNFFPQSSVSARVFMAAGQIARVLESLKTAWEQTRPRLGFPPPPPPNNDLPEFPGPDFDGPPSQHPPTD